MAPVVEIAAPRAVRDTDTLCDLARRALCFWRCDRDYFFAEGSKCAAARDACAAACCPRRAWVVRALGTTREREMSKYADPLERKEFLGTLTEEEARLLRRRRAETKSDGRGAGETEHDEAGGGTTETGASVDLVKVEKGWGRRVGERER